MTLVSIIVPCFNEEGTISQLLNSLLAQHFPIQQMQVIVADGLSTDGTRRRIQSFQQSHREMDIRVIDNPTRQIPAALNLALRASKGDTVIRLDAHCIPEPDYVSRCIAALEAGRGWNVGGVWDIRPGAPGWIADSISVAASHPLGVGDAYYRFTNKAGEADTVPFGAFRRELIDRIGGFDETLLANEDYEFNARIRRTGGKVWLDPSIRSIYFARSNLQELARQYWRYGYWKWRMVKRYPLTLRLRQALPPLFVLSSAGLLILGAIIPLARWLLLVGVVSYFLVLFGAALREALVRKKMYLVIGIPLAIATMHLAWGTGFLGSMVSPTK